MNMQDDPLKDVIEDDDFEEIVDVTDIGDAASEAGPFGIDYAKITFSEFFFGGNEGKAWDVDLDEFLNDVEDDPDAATLLGAAKEFDLDAELEDDIEDAFLDAGPNEIDPDLEGSSQDELEDKEHLMPFFSLFACFILMVFCAGFLICMFLGYV